MDYIHKFVHTRTHIYVIICNNNNQGSRGYQFKSGRTMGTVEGEKGRGNIIVIRLKSLKSKTIT